LLTAAAWARHRGEEKRAVIWEGAAARIKTTLLAQCWNGNYFARGVNEYGTLDWQVDSSMLGVFDPFRLLSLDDPREREMVENMARVVCERLTKTLPEGDGIMRHEGDDYIDGSAGGVNTLWLARVLLRLAKWYAGKDTEKVLLYRSAAERYLHVVIARGTTTGLLPELIGGGATHHWAAPHGWAMANYIRCALLLDEMGNG